MRIDDRHGLAGIVDEQPLAGDMGLAHRRRDAARANPGRGRRTGCSHIHPVARLDTPPTAAASVTPGRRSSAWSRAQSGCGRGLSWTANGGLNSRALQRRVVQLGRHRPGDADHRRAAQILGHRVAADPDRGGDAALAVAGSVLETQNFSDLTHRQSLGWHGAPRCCSGERAVG